MALAHAYDVTPITVYGTVVVAPTETTDAKNLTQAQLNKACGTDVKPPTGLTLNKPCPAR